MSKRAQLWATVEMGPQGRGERSDEPFRLLVLTGLSRPVSGEARLTPRPITIDGLDEAVAAVGPAVASPGDPHRGLALHALDHFHPDHLAANLPELAELLELRSVLRDAARRDAALAKIEELAGGRITGLGGPRAQPLPPADEDTEGLLARVLGGAAGAEPRSRAGRTVDALIRDALGDAAATATTGADNDAEAQLGRLLDERCRAVLLAPEFRALERAWRSLHWLLSRLEDDTAEVCVLDMDKATLAAHLESFAGDLEASPLHTLLADDERGFDLIVGDYTFALAADDILTLATIGALAARARAPFFAHGELSLAGCLSDDAIHHPSSWSLPDDDLGRLWAEFRSHPAARWVGLATPRFLLRYPYGSRNDPIERFDFEELPSRPERDRFLWGNPAFACALLLARAHGRDGTHWPSSTPAPVSDLPTPRYDDGDGEAIQPPLEFILGERARATAEQRGLMVLVSGHNTNRIAADDLFPVGET